MKDEDKFKQDKNSEIQDPKTLAIPKPGHKHKLSTVLKPKSATRQKHILSLIPQNLEG